jgi:Ca-activated chloride channel homolog
MNAAPGLALVTLSFVAAGWTSGQAQIGVDQPRQTFRTSADIVTIQASVRNTQGRPIQGLTTADFEVRDNGQLRPILSLRSDRTSPISLAILVDTSGSMGIGPKVAMAGQAFESVLSQLRAGRDELGIFTFDSELREHRAFTSDPSELTGALEDVEPFGTTSLFDATAAVARRLADRSATHKAVLVLTDGADTSSMLGAAEVSALASAIAVPVYILATVPPVDRRDIMETTEPVRQPNTVDLRDLAELTGGQLVFASSFTETAAAASRLVTHLRLQYVLAIEATGEREWRRLDVRVKRPSAVVKARSGYFGG